MRCGLTSTRKPGSPGKKNLLTICLLMVIFLMFAYAIFGSRGVLRIFQAEKQKHELELELAKIRHHQEQLRHEIERLQKDKSYWEQLARTKIGMVREGELIYYLPDKDIERKRK